MSNFLTKEALLTRDTLKVTKVEFEDGKFVFVREMTGHEKDQFEQSLRRDVKNAKGVTTGFEAAINDYRAKLAVMTLCDEDGKLLLAQKEYNLLAQNISASRLEKICDEASKLNAISEEDKELLVKNSEAGQEDVSNSSSAEN